MNKPKKGGKGAVVFRLCYPTSKKKAKKSRKCSWLFCRITGGRCTKPSWWMTSRVFMMTATFASATTGLMSASWMTQTSRAPWCGRPVLKPCHAGMLWMFHRSVLECCVAFASCALSICWFMVINIVIYPLTVRVVGAHCGAEHTSVA